MRNLRVSHRSLLKSSSGATLTAAAFDVASDSVVCAFGPTKEDSLVQLKRWNRRDGNLSLIASWDAPCPSPDLVCDRILNLHFFSDSTTACLVFAGGDIVIVREDASPGEDKIEIMGSAHAGVSAAAWSPDEGLLAMTTKADTLIYMTREFESVTEIALSADDLKVSDHVSVGWGKKETQFKGKKARALRDPTVPESVDEGRLSEYDMYETTISWRGDGDYVAINSVVSDCRRVIRVYSRDGILNSVSEPVDNLVGALSWRPAGNLLAALQYHDSQAKVVFFERNGLRHGQFDLRLSREELETWGSEISLEWNVDSSVLAICLSDRIQLWAMSNYHYYLKQEIFSFSSSTANKAAACGWHPEEPLQLIVSSEGGIQSFLYSSVVCGGPATKSEDYGVVAVIDGKCLKITPLRLVNVPPPMALHEITLESNALDVTITTTNTDTKAIQICVLHHKGCSLYEWPMISMMQSPPFHKWTINPYQHGDNSNSMYLQAAFSGETSDRKSILLLRNSVEVSTIHAINLLGQTVKELSAPGGAIEGIVSSGPCTQQSGTYIITNERKDTAAGDLVKDISDFNQQNNVNIAVPPFSVGRADAVRYSGGTDYPKDKESTYEEITFSLSENGSLFANERRLARNCTSFLVTPAHLILTTSQHLLKFVHLPCLVEGISQIEHELWGMCFNNDLLELSLPPDTPETDERCRSIERGAKLVAAMPSIFAVVLQMPRGNLETIHPRALVLVGIRTNINEKKYRKAFFACRNHRVDMNILHDHDPGEFIANVPLFLDQVQKVEHIDLFLSQLRDEDVSETMYKDTNPDPGVSELQKPEAIPASISKVSKVCNAFLDALENRTSTHFQNVVTAHVCKIPPDLDAGLLQIADIRRNNPELVHGAIEHICFLADVNRLYDNCLGLYDLQLALLVAQQSQKDPKEYLPFLRNLQKEPLLRRKYWIDDHLGRHRKALRHLCELNAFDEVKTYAIKHSLYTEAMEYYRYQDNNLENITRLYGDYLNQQGKYKEAGLAFEYLNDYHAAMDAYRQAYLWKESISCATMIPVSQSQLQSLCTTIADTLSESKDYFSAAIIHTDYLSDIPTAARLFCKGYYFADAFRIIGLHHRPDLLESVIDVGLVEGMASMTELLADCKSQINAQVPRIQELRVKQAEDPLAFFNGDAHEGLDIPDNVSLAPTDSSTMGGSLFTRYTNRTGTVGTNATRRTSKNRRREERKKARGKKGSIYEEEYLINSIGRLIERVNSVNEEVDRLVMGLIRRGMRERAVAVENAMNEVVSLCNECTEEVFRAGEKGKAVEHKDISEGAIPKGWDGVMWDTLHGEKRREVPVVKSFSRRLLLGQ
ncbi:putative elongator complex protein 1 [Lecanora helva]